MASIFYNEFWESLMTKAISLTADTINLELRTNTYSPDKDHNHAALTNEVTGGVGGYTTGGTVLVTKTVTKDDANDRGVFDAVDTEWAGATFTARYGTIYDITAGKNVCCIDFGGDVAVVAGTFKVQWNAAGIFYLN